MLLEFAAFISLRIKKPDLQRPYKVPLQTLGAALLCLPPALLLILVMCLASLKTFLVSGVVILLGFLLYPALVYAKQKNWFHFYTDEPSSSANGDDLGDQSVTPHGLQKITDEASVSLL